MFARVSLQANARDLSGETWCISETVKIRSVSLGSVTKVDSLDAYFVGHCPLLSVCLSLSLSHTHTHDVSEANYTPFFRY